MKKFNNIWKNPNNQNIHFTKNKLPYEHINLDPKRLKKSTRYYSILFGMGETKSNEKL